MVEIISGVPLESSSVVKRLPLKLGPDFLPPTPQGPEPQWQNKADECSQPHKGALQVNVQRHNSAECSERAGDEPCSLQPGGRQGSMLCIPRESILCSSALYQNHLLPWWDPV